MHANRFGTRADRFQAREALGLTEDGDSANGWLSVQPRRDHRNVQPLEVGHFKLDFARLSLTGTASDGRCAVRAPALDLSQPA